MAMLWQTLVISDGNDALMDKFLIKYSRNETWTATVSVPVCVSEEDDDGESKAKKKKGPVEANKTKT